MSMTPFNYETYQDVRTNIAVYTAVALGLSALVFYAFVITSTQREWMSQVFHQEYLGYFVTPLFFLILGYFLIEVLKVHDKIYDRYIVKWRLKYDLTTILPALIEPFENTTDSQFLDTAKSNRTDFMERLYYEFVGDREHEYPITKNYLVRFYEAISAYWYTQVNDIILILLSVISIVLLINALATSQNPNRFIITIGVIATLFIVNRFAVKRSRSSVAQATMREIHDIHEKYLVVLENRMIELHREHGLLWHRNTS